MTLQEKFEKDNDINSTIDYMYIADEFAIGFAVWLDKNKNKKDHKGFFLEQLLEIYKREKGL